LAILKGTQMARSKSSDAENRSAQPSASRFNQSGSQTSYPKDNGFDSKGDNFASDTKPKSGNPAKKDEYFSNEWLDDSGTAEEMRPNKNLGASAQLADGIRDAANSTARAVKQQAAAVASEIGHELEKTASEQVSHGAEAIRGFATAVEAAGLELEKVSPHLARYVNDSADKIREVSNSLSSRQVNDIVRMATDFARSQPVLFLGAAVATGFALARFLKSSAKVEEMYPDSIGDSGVMPDRTMTPESRRMQRDDMAVRSGGRSDTFASPRS
jgi:hypothetical protein